ncbi:MAG: YihY/virulence factor BrkB family protein [Actinomycetota bacterium]|nr:YihY/virulence factor BrkB family protein [Actinomycetota bacterium]
MPSEPDGNGADLRALSAFDRDGVPAFDEDAAGARSGPKQRVLEFARKRNWPWLGRALQVYQRFQDIRGGDLASALTLQAFLGLFPLLIVGVAVLGYIQSGSADFAADLIDDLGLDGEAARILNEALDTAAKSRRTATAIGLFGLLWAGLGFTAALRLAYNQAWQVQARGWRDRLAGLLWFVGAGALFLVGLAATAAMNVLPGPLWPMALIFGLLVNFVLFVWTARVLPNIDVGLRALLPGAVFAAAGLEILKIAGAFVLPRMISSASALWGTLGILFAILGWLLFFGRLLVYAAVIDVVRYEAHAGTVAGLVDQPRHRGATRAVTRGGSSRPDGPPVVSVPSEVRSS